MFFGLNIAARLTHYALTEDGAHFIQGTVTLDTPPALLAAHAVHAVACGYTGRLAEPWTLIAAQDALPAYLLYSWTCPFQMRSSR